MEKNRPNVPAMTPRQVVQPSSARNESPCQDDETHHSSQAEASAHTRTDLKAAWRMRPIRHGWLSCAQDAHPLSSEIELLSDWQTVRSTLICRFAAVRDKSRAMILACSKARTTVQANLLFQKTSRVPYSGEIADILYYLFRYRQWQNVTELHIRRFCDIFKRP